MADIPLRPLGANFYGVFIGPVSGTAWVNWDFETDFKPQIDHIKALGANYVSFWGAYHTQAAADLPLYLSRRRQFVEYLAKVGLYGLPYANQTPAGWNASENAVAISVYVQDAALMASFPNIIGYVCMDEPFLSGWTNAEVVARAAAQYSAVRAVVPADFPICCTPIGISGNVFDYTGANKTDIDDGAPYCDFFAFHPFATSSASQLTALRAAYPTKQIMLPSTVAAQEGYGYIPQVTSSIMGLVGANGVRGMGYWIAKDWIGTSTTYGMWNSDYSERPIKTTAFRDGITAAGALTAMPRHPIRPTRRSARLNHLHQWGYK